MVSKRLTTPGTLWWDFDGTLVSRPSMWADVGIRLLDRCAPGHGVPAAAIRDGVLRGLPWHREDHAHPDLDTADRWWDAVYRRYAEIFAGLHCNPAIDDAALPAIRHDILDASAYHVFDDVPAALTRAAATGWRNIIVSNHVPELPDLVAALGLTPFFEAIVTSGVVGYEKPHRRLFEEAMRHTPPGHAVWMIGDNCEADCRPVCAMGMNAVLLRTTTTPAFQHEAADAMAAVELIGRAE